MKPTTDLVPVRKPGILGSVTPLRHIFQTKKIVVKFLFPIFADVPQIHFALFNGKIVSFKQYKLGIEEAYSGFWWGNLRERGHLGDTGVNRRIILRWMFRK